MKKLLLAVAVFSVSYASYAFAAGDPGKAPAAKKEHVSMKKSCDDLCEAIKSKSQEVNDFKDQAHEKGMEPKEKAKLQKKIANLKKDVTEAVLQWQGIPETLWSHFQLLLPSDAGTGAVEHPLLRA